MTGPSQSPLERAFGLAGKHALVTGGGSGLGLAIAKAFAAAGAGVTIAGRRLELLEQAAAEIGPNARIARLDLRDIGSIKGFAAAVEAEHGQVDILVNNAGNTVKKPFEEQTAEDLDQVFDVHVRGALELTRSIIPGQAARGCGSVLFIASMTSFIGQPLVIGYTAAKSALTGVVRGLSAEYSGRNVRVNAIAPGWIDTDLFRAATSNDKTRYDKIIGRIQMGRVGKPEDIGWASVFLASPAAAYVTGQTLVVDGGALVGF
ncbi:SDR family oxidoreductase [Mesorhizobium sp. BAC0120]|uniref:SDR family NAD(P)-dependent oxidoreductase n=1 Tax=Mesorhizobium sp. BAC0120 TaxID=3090670 RepID=UPI00298C0A96|nr:SDR family oxidoreductase [Mesorhizobium sp. BAC0120]MDW6020761.1 SDR family oxidoreductase [Mesorhizobium sp. BAC0120]